MAKELIAQAIDERGARWCALINFGDIEKPSRDAASLLSLGDSFLSAVHTYRNQVSPLSRSRDIVGGGYK